MYAKLILKYLHKLLDMKDLYRNTEQENRPETCSLTKNNKDNPVEKLSRERESNGHIRVLCSWVREF